MRTYCRCERKVGSQYTRKQDEYADTKVTQRMQLVLRLMADDKTSNLLYT